MREQRPYTEIRVQLPVFLVLAIRQLVRDANEQAPAVPWTVSLLLERWLSSAITAKEMTAIARKSPEFKRAVEAWLKWLGRQR